MAKINIKQMVAMDSSDFFLSFFSPNYPHHPHYQMEQCLKRHNHILMKRLIDDFKSHLSNGGLSNYFQRFSVWPILFCFNILAIEP